MFDQSAWMLLAANLVTLAGALAGQWHVADLMAIYWAQSLIIGLAYVGRIRNLERFSTDNFTMNGQSVPPNDETKRKVAAFFVMHYGGFHAVYFGFIATGATLAASPEWGFGLLLCVGGFVANHLFSYRYHLALDRAGTPNIGTLMFTPYLRVVPMHAAILGAGLLDAHDSVLIVFILLKTASDLAMHWVEHRLIGRSASQRAGASGDQRSGSGPS